MNCEESSPQGEDENAYVTTVESACPQCLKNGTTRLLLINIPFFRDVAVMSFECEHCGHKNSEIQADNSREDYGEKICLCVQNVKDMNRAVVKGTHSMFALPHIDFEIPPHTQTGVVSNVEGIISNAVKGLQMFQPQRLEQDRGVGEKVQIVIDKLTDLLQGNAYPFELCLDDPSGNSYIESLTPPHDDPQMSRSRYTPSREQLHIMGFYEAETTDPTEDVGDAEIEDTESEAHIDSYTHTHTHTQSVDLEHPKLNLAQEAVDFESLCPHSHQSHAIMLKLIEYIDPTCLRCSTTCTYIHARFHMGMQINIHTCTQDIPGFRTCILMAFSCLNCGAKTNEIRPSGAIGDKGCIWELEVHTQEDLNRDLIKSDYCHVTIPCLDFEMMPGSQGAFLTTVEGLLTQTADHLDKAYPFTGDSSDKSVAEVIRYRDTIDELRKLTTDPNRRPFKLILDDAADQSMIGSRTNLGSYEDNTVDKKLTHLLDPHTRMEDPCLKRTFYERTDEQNDDLGLKDMKIDNY